MSKITAQIGSGFFVETENKPQKSRKGGYVIEIEDNPRISLAARERLSKIIQSARVKQDVDTEKEPFNDFQYSGPLDKKLIENLPQIDAILKNLNYDVTRMTNEGKYHIMHHFFRFTRLSGEAIAPAVNQTVTPVKERLDPPDIDTEIPCPKCGAKLCFTGEGRWQCYRQNKCGWVRPVNDQQIDDWKANYTDEELEELEEEITINGDNCCDLDFDERMDFIKRYHALREELYDLCDMEDDGLFSFLQLAHNVEDILSAIFNDGWGRALKKVTDDIPYEPHVVTDILDRIKANAHGSIKHSGLDARERSVMRSIIDDSIHHTIALDYLANGKGV